MSGGGGQTSTVTNQLSPFQEKYLTPFVEALSEISKVPQGYIGTGYVDPTEDFYRGLSDTTRAANFSVGAANRGGEVANQFMGGQRDISTGGQAPLDRISTGGALDTGNVKTVGMAPLGDAASLAEMRDKIGRDVQGSVNTMFSRGGRFGGGAGKTGLATKMFTDSYAPIAMNAYENQQNRLLQGHEAYAGRDLSAGLANQQQRLAAYEAAQGRGLDAASRNVANQLASYENWQNRALGADRQNQANVLQAMGMLPQFNQMSQDVADRFFNTDIRTRGEEYDRRMQSEGGVEQSIFERDEARNRAERFIQAIMGITPQNQVSSGSLPGQGGSMAMQGIGLALTAASLF